MQIIEKDIVLIIEDDNNSVVLLKEYLSDLDYKILVFDSVQDSYPVDKNDTGIVLMSCDLPGIGFEEAFRDIRAKLPMFPVLALKGKDDQIKDQEIVDQGVEDYLLKGEFDKKALLKAIKYALTYKRVSTDYKRLFDENPGPMYFYDQETLLFLGVNNAALNQYGYTRDEFLALDARQIRPDDTVEAFEKTNETVPRAYFDYGRWKHKKKNGEVFFVHIYAHTIVFEGKVARLVFAADIDKKVKAEIAIREKSEEITTILNSITDGFFAIDKEWKLTFANKECERIYKMPASEMIGRNIWELLPQARHLKFFTELSRSMSEHVSVSFEEYDPAHDAWLDVSAYPSKDGLAVYFIDVTEKRMIQEKIFVDEQNLRAIIDNTSDLIWSIDRNNNIISANSAFWEKIELITGKRNAKVERNEYSGGLYEEWQGYLQSAFEGEIRKTIWRPPGETETIHEVRFNPIRDQEDQIIGISCFSRDITQEYIHKKMIEKQNKQLREIAYIQSHKVRSPVTSILGLVQLFNKENTSDPVNTEIISKLEEATIQLDDIIKSINSYTITATDQKLI